MHPTVPVLLPRLQRPKRKGTGSPCLRRPAVTFLAGFGSTRPAKSAAARLTRTMWRPGRLAPCSGCKTPLAVPGPPGPKLSTRARFRPRVREGRSETDLAPFSNRSSYFREEATVSSPNLADRLPGIEQEEAGRLSPFSLFTPVESPCDRAAWRIRCATHAHLGKALRINCSVFQWTRR